MNLKFNKDKMYILQEAFNDLLPDSLTMNQYQLAEQTEFDADEWSEFLHDGAVSKAIESEVALIIRANKAKLITSAADNDRSVGAAQMLNAMGKIDGDDKSEEHFYIYSYVPLTPNEEKADHVRQEDNWRPPEVIQEEIQTEAEKELEEFCNTEIKTEVAKEPSKKIDEEDWF